jgi:pyruvate/2-oxoglutarate dehydrogenase complex dihydrolipoamide dehydrogenase (E3) component
VVLIEKARMGGDCLNTGCVPSKSLIAAAKHAHAITHARAFGISARVSGVDFAAVHKHIHDVIAGIAPNDSSERFTGLGVRVIAGAARFRDAETVTVDDELEIKARRFVIATGSSPTVPPIPGIKQTPYLTNETVFDLTILPAHLIIIGAGPVGLELAQAFRRLGAQVTVLDVAQALAREDDECAAIVLDALAEEGVDLRINVGVARVEALEAGIRIVVLADGSEESITGSHLLLAAGRRAAADGLGLDQAGIRYDGGGILVDKGLKTTNRRVYAIGDVAGGVQFTHLAGYHAGLVIRNALFRLPVKVNEDIIPRVTFTDPELAHVGLSEADARSRRMRFKILRWPYREIDRARAERETRGHIKVITSARGRILGATIVGANAGELIATWALAVSKRLNVRTLAGMVIPYPTFAEVGKRAAMTYFLPGARSPMVARLIAFLRRFG